METLTLARNAMNTRFEILLHGDDRVQLQSAGEQALEEITGLESQLSLYRPTSEISAVNRHASERPVRVTPPVFRLLSHAQRLSEETSGAFDVTVAPLVRAWGFMGGSGSRPGPESLSRARALVGMHKVLLDPEAFTVRFLEPGMMIDLGAIGKGYAVDQAVEVLTEAGVSCAFVHGGTSSSYGLGIPPDVPSWKAAIAMPGWIDGVAQPSEGGETLRGDSLLATVELCGESLGVSAIWGRSFRDEAGRTFGHVVDPRTGEPVQGGLLAAVVTSSAAESDALSTALLTLGEAGWDHLIGLRRGMRGLLVVPDRAGAGGVRTLRHGL